MATDSDTTAFEPCGVHIYVMAADRVLWRCPIPAENSRPPGRNHQPPKTPTGTEGDSRSAGGWRAILSLSVRGFRGFLILGTESVLWCQEVSRA